MLGMLVIILGSDRVADLSFGAGECQIPLILFLPVLGMPWTRTGAIIPRPSI
jgi:hypothetical protein